MHLRYRSFLLFSLCFVSLLSATYSFPLEDSGEILSILDQVEENDGKLEERGVKVEEKKIKVEEKKTKVEEKEEKLDEKPEKGEEKEEKLDENGDAPTLSFDPTNEEFQAHVTEINNKLKEFGRNLTDFTNINFKPTSLFEVLPADYLCEFCTAVIQKLKEQQKVQGAEFEVNMRKGCWAINRTEEESGKVCELVNKVNLERLQNDSVDDICSKEKFCPDKNAAKLEKLKELEKIEKAKEEEREEERNKEMRKLMAEKARLELIAIERAKDRLAREEYENTQAEEKRKRREKMRIHVFRRTNKDIEYIADEVNLHEEEANDYLNEGNEKEEKVAAPKKGSEKGAANKGHPSGTVIDSDADVGKIQQTPLGSKFEPASPGTITQNIQGEVTDSPKKAEKKKLNMILDRTVTLMMMVQDP